MKQSRLHAQHIQLGAMFEEVTGWEMPAHYGDWRAEYDAIRQAVGVADLSHRGKVRVTGDDRVKWLQSVLSNDILPLQPGQGRYSSFLTHKGKMLTYFRCYVLTDAAGKEIILVETVGAGQDEVEVADTAHTTIVVNIPGAGDDMQAIKAGIMEIADIFVVNKADSPLAARAERALAGMLALRPRAGWTPPVASSCGARCSKDSWPPRHER